ncbi:MAG: guanosine monophosphate reductase [Candidatus Woesebacteria bacterium]|jgi:IMP dehydrogenase
MSKKFYKALGEFENWPEISHQHPASLTYTNVMLQQQLSNIKSRSDIDLSSKLGPYKLKIPIITSPMDTVTGLKMIKEMHKLGGIGTLPRGNTKKNLKICRKLSKEKIPCIYCVGLSDTFNLAKQYKRAGAKVILIDVANGAMQRLINVASKIKEKLKLTVIAGNITTYDLAVKYKEAGIDIARVGVGPGGACTTRKIAGTGFPQLSAVLETSQSGIPIIADGGIREPGDMAKAIAAGADYVMIGSLFAGTDETPGEVEDGKKILRGQASESYMNDHGVAITARRAPEGLSTLVAYKGPVKNVIHELEAGLASAMSYSGATKLKDFQNKAAFILASREAQSTGGRMAQS